MVEKPGVADADRQRILHLLARFGVVAIDIERPGISIERVHILAPRRLDSCDAQSPGYPLGVTLGLTFRLFDKLQ